MQECGDIAWSLPVSLDQVLVEKDELGDGNSQIGHISTACASERVGRRAFFVALAGTDY